jgi:haloalkane dehalogenase
MIPYNTPLFPFESKWANINGNKIHYVDEGRGPALLFCHPSVATMFMYRKFIKELSKNYRCVALDFPGFGLSAPKPGYRHSIEAQAETLKGLIVGLDLKNIVPVLQEVGGHAAVTALRSMPERVAGVIITDTIIYPVSEYPKIASMLNFIDGAFFRLLSMQFNLLIRVTYSVGIRNRKLDRREKAAYRALFDTKHKRRLVTLMLHAIKDEEKLMQGVKEAFANEFRDLPTLMIYGERDPMREMGIADRIHSELPFSELHVIKGEGHFPHEGAPDEMISIIKSWLAVRKAG